MRVIAGKARSLPLKTPTGNTTRPTTDRIKETLFNMLSNKIPGCVFLDLFAGSGAIGIEALSRGADKAYFVEQDRAACKCICENLEFTRLNEYANVLNLDVYNSFHRITDREVDIIFADPPYHLVHEEKLVSALSKMNFVTENTIIILEADLKTSFHFVDSYGFTIMKEKKYKTNKHVFLRKVIE